METGEGEKAEKELSRYYVHNMESILIALREAECPECKEKGFLEVNRVDFENNKVLGKCINCNSILDVNLTPSTKLIKKGRK